MLGTTQLMEPYPNGRGDLGRTPVFSQTDLVVAHEVKMGEVKKLRFEFNMFNLFNQKTAQYLYPYVNRALEYPDTSGVDLTETDLAKGYDYTKLLGLSTDGLPFALHPLYKKQDHFAEGFSGRFLIKFIF